MQTPIEYHTVFTLLEKSAPSFPLVAPVALIVVGTVCGVATIIRRRPVRGVRPSIFLVLCAFFVLCGVYVLHEINGFNAWQRQNYEGLKNAYLAGQYSVVEGTVTNFHPMPAEGHDYETFRVNGVPFSFSDFDGRHCFNNAASHGGPLHEGLRVRIAYSGNCIWKLEVATDR